MATKRKAPEELLTRGRPLVIAEATEMEAKAEDYFADCELATKPFTMAGLCYALGFSDRHALAEYEKRPAFSATVKRLRLRIEQQRSEALVDKDKFTPGQIFDLKNNHGWVDKQEIAHSASDELIKLLDNRRKRARGA
jgi:hypothetical protein